MRYTQNVDQRGSDADGVAAPSGAAGLESMLSVDQAAGAPPVGHAPVADPHVSHRGPGLPAWPVWLRVVPLAAGAALAVAVLTWAGGDGRTGAASTPGAVVAGEPRTPVTVTAPAGAPRGYTGIPVTVIGPTTTESPPALSESHATPPPGGSSEAGAVERPGGPASATDPTYRTGPGSMPADPPAQSAPPDRRPGEPGGSTPASGGPGTPTAAPDDPSRDPVSGPGPSDPDNGTDPTDPPEPVRPPDHPEPQGPPDLPPGLVDNPAEPQPQGITRAF